MAQFFVYTKISTQNLEPKIKYAFKIIVIRLSL